MGGRRKRVVKIRSGREVEIRSGREVEVRSDLAAVYKLHENLRMLGNGSSLSFLYTVQHSSAK